MAGTYQDFLDALGHRESGGDYRAVNQFDYLGKYQMGEGALIDTGYYTPDGTSRNDWQKSHFTGKGGIDSKAEFLASPAAARGRHSRLYGQAMAIYRLGAEI